MQLFTTVGAQGISSTTAAPPLAHSSADGAAALSSPLRLLQAAIVLLVLAPLFYAGVLQLAPSALQPHTALLPHALPQQCLLRFEEYLPSALEQAWAAHVASLDAGSLTRRSFCDDITSAQFLEPMQAWIGLGAEQNAVRPRSQAGLAQQAAALAARPDVFSRLAYRDSCSGARREVPVAPLAGILRDPRAPCAKKVITPLLFDSGRGETLQPKDNVIVDPEHVAAVAAALRDARAAGRSPRAILLDAGASTYNGQDEGWPGTRWLVERYRDLGLNFTDIYAWEFTPRPGYEYFNGMSTELVGRTHFYNFGASNQEGPKNPVSVLKSVAQPGDFVVFKLDIDTPTVETPMVQDLLQDDAALALITDFYYELHFGLKDMDWAWGEVASGSDLASATEVFKQFREKGVKAQMWP